MLVADIPGRLRETFDRLRGRAVPSCKPVNYFSDGASWALDHMAQEICEEVNRLHSGKAQVVTRPAGLTHSVVHFGTRYLWLGWKDRLPPGNRIVVTCLHGTDAPDDSRAPEVEKFLGTLGAVDHIVTTNTLIARRLRAWGVPETKPITVLGHGVNRRRFRPATEGDRGAARRELGVPDGVFCIGSFQKDGEGWGDGMVPKRVKGPDVFLETLARLKDSFPIVVLLTGPARGYVKAGLERLGVPFRHVLPKHHDGMTACYHALDMYLVASRDEGGPVALMENMACGVPVVSTPVGMSPDVIRDSENGFLGRNEDPDSLAAAAAKVLADPHLRRRVSVAAAETARDYDCRLIGRRHYDEVYAPLLGRLGR